MQTFSAQKFNPKNNVIAVHSQILDVKMEIYVWLMEMPQQEEWIFVPVVYGHMYATNHGIPMMLELPAENWAYQVPVCSTLHSTFR